MDLGKAPSTGTIELILFTALITGLVSLLMGVFGKAAAEWALNLTLRPVRAVKEAVYRWIAPRNPLSISLRSYKKHVSRSYLTRIDNPVGPNLHVPLEQAFAPLKLISGSTEESVDLFSLVAASHRCIVLGGPGTGKTTLMKSLVTRVVEGRVREEPLKALIPVFVLLRNLAKNEHTVEQAVVAAFHEHHFPGADKFVESALSQGKMLVILDGLDEVGASRDFVSEQIQHFCEHDDQRPHRNRLVVTCRENSYRTKDLQGVIPEVVRVEPFANHHMRVFLEGWPPHKGRSAVKLYGLIQSDPQIRDICRNPLLLTILTGLYLDTDNFELPTSRERFYRDAVDELLDQRPARRHSRQTYDADDKRQILERVALERLETVERGEDPEEFTREVIRRKAEEVLSREKFDPRELIKELVEINGIIKPASDGNYTCAHRTIQEYFAAREAGRTRKTREVVEHFGGRPEFIEVLYFYCALLRNIPDLASIINTLVGQGRWLEAGRCMLHMKEPPARAQVQRVARELHALVSPSVEYKAALEVLSSLAQRRAPEFDPARDEFAQAVDELAGAYGESGAAALESALATSPEPAMKVIPGLLIHQSPRWREAGVRLLRDIGTDEALDQLVLLLTNKDPIIRDRAAFTLAGMFKGRQRELRARAVLLPERRDPTVWPLEDYFPSRLAIPIAESLTNSVFSQSQAIAFAAFAVRERARGMDPDRHFLRKWRRVPRDLKLARWRRRVGRAVVLGGYLLVVASLLTPVVLQALSSRTNRAVLLTDAPLRLHWIDVQPFDRFKEHAKAVVADIERRFPPKASGLSGIMPWSWSGERDLPEGKEKFYEILKGEAPESSDPYAILDTLDLSEMRGFISDEKLAQLSADLGALRRQLPDLRGGGYVFITPAPFYLILIVFVMTLVLTYGMTMSGANLLIMVFSIGRDLGAHKRSLDSEVRRVDSADMFKRLGALDGKEDLSVNLGWVIGVLIISVPSLITFVKGSSRLWTLPILALLACYGIGAFLQKINWPNNSLMTAVADLTPQSPAVGESGLEENNEKGEDVKA